MSRTRAGAIITRQYRIKVTIRTGQASGEEAMIPVAAM